ncbi:MAG: hypothetical protein AAGI24_11100 [Pseudomonadota bacterium]
MAALMLLTTAAQASVDSCLLPDTPGLPDGATANLSTMVAGQQAVKAYMAEAEAYLDCLIAQESAAAASETEELRLVRLQAHDSAVEAMETLAEAFNAEIREYKAQGS